MPPEVSSFEKLLERAREIYQIIISPQLRERIFPLKVIFILCSILFFLAIIFFLKKTKYLREHFFEDLEDLASFKDFGQKKWPRRWKKIKRKIEKGKDQSHWKIGLIQANKMLAEVLEQIGLGSGSFEDRLKKLTESDVSNLDQLKIACQVCQDISRDPDYRLERERAEKMIEIFEKAFQDLNLF